MRIRRALTVTLVAALGLVAFGGSGASAAKKHGHAMKHHGHAMKHHHGHAMEHGPAMR